MNSIAPIRVRKTPNADTRSANQKITKELLKSESILHREDVAKGMELLAREITTAGKRHDWTKIHCLNMFYNDVKTTQEKGSKGGDSFKQLPWYQLHITQERHHLNGKAPNDVNLIDVLEMVTDCVMAGLARNGKVTKEYFELDSELLQKAVFNTALLLKEYCVVVDNE